MEEQVLADLVYYRPIANGATPADTAAAADKGYKKVPMERTPDLEQQRGPGRPMRSLPPLQVFSQLTDDAAGPRSGLMRGESAPPYSGPIHLSGIFPLPIRTPEPEALQVGGNGVQTIMPRFLVGPTSLDQPL